MAADGIAKLDRDLHRKAKRKLDRGERPTQEETAAFRRVEKVLAKERLLEALGSVPKGVYQEMAGRPAQVLNDQAASYGMPIGGARIDLAAVIRWWHDTLGRHGRKILPIVQGTDAGADPRLNGAATWQEKKLREEALKAQIEREQLEAALVPREEVHQLLTLVASRLRGAGEQIQRCETGLAAFDALQLAIDEIEQEVERYFDDDDQGEAAA